MTGQQTIKLYIAGKFTGLTLRTDAEWSAMWRLHHGNRVSDIVNLPRAKDAAVAWARPRGLGGGETVRWDRRETAREAPPMRQSEGVATSGWTDWPAAPVGEVS
jgi:hypothetical protein